jgi:transposase InsO family protein
MPVLQATSPTAKNVTRRWTNPDDFTREVANARIYEGVHFRTATDVGTAMGRRIGGLAVSNYRLLAE